MDPRLIMIGSYSLLSVIILTLALTLGFLGAPLWAWSILIIAGLFSFQVPIEVITAIAAVLVVWNVPALRTLLVSQWLLKLVNAIKLFPAISDTEKTALKAGDVWVEGELFSGRPNLKKLVAEPYPQLTAEEKAFIDGPVEKLCELCDDWEVWKNRDLSPEAWDLIKKAGFLGMVIPKKYGGLGFSALAHSEVLCKLNTRCLPACISVMVPNSLGPGELLVHYGTEKQKDYYLPRLARGEEIPCFGLTEPTAGSDAASITAEGIVFKGDDGKLYIRLNWNKRWITLAAASTIIGLAFRLKDPQNFLGKGEDIGITCALVPKNTPGVKADRRHDPLYVPFYNCPTQGKDVVIPADNIIGGTEWAGKGWQMLMESLAAGRGISLPAQTTGGTKFVARVASAHSTVRKQFGISIGKFEGIQEPLARIAGFAYMLEAGRRYTLGAIDKGIKPPVVTAIAKYNFTEISRQVINDGMDIQGGQAISRGPRNLLAHNYIATPIGVTVEGANILTRTLIIFGQGAIRAHPYAYKEIEAAETNNAKNFDAAFWGHVGHVIRNLIRTLLLSITRGRLAAAPVSGPHARYWKKLSWVSATFALMADMAMLGLGGKLKFKEMITGRFADILSWMYIITAVLRRYEADGRRKEDYPFVRWCMNYGFHKITRAFEGIFANMEMPLLTWFFRGPVLWFMRMSPMGHPSSDKTHELLAALAQIPGEQRSRLFDNVYEPKKPNEQFKRLEDAFELTVQSEEVAAKVRKAVKSKKLSKKPPKQLYQDALAQGVITQKEFESIDLAEKARYEAIQVDDFGLDEYKNHYKH